MGDSRNPALRVGVLALQGGFAAELDAYQPLIATQDRREALKAFAEKRPPEWTGK